MFEGGKKYLGKYGLYSRPIKLECVENNVKSVESFFEI